MTQLLTAITSLSCKNTVNTISSPRAFPGRDFNTTFVKYASVDVACSANQVTNNNLV